MCYIEIDEKQTGRCKILSGPATGITLKGGLNPKQFHRSLGGRRWAGWGDKIQPPSPCGHAQPFLPPARQTKESGLKRDAALGPAHRLTQGRGRLPCGCAEWPSPREVCKFHSDAAQNSVSPKQVSRPHEVPVSDVGTRGSGLRSISTHTVERASVIVTCLSVRDLTCNFSNGPGRPQ